MRFQVARARGYFDSGKLLLPLLPVRIRGRARQCSVGCTAACWTASSQRGYDVFERRIALGNDETKLTLAVRLWLAELRLPLKADTPLRGDRRRDLAGLAAACVRRLDFGVPLSPSSRSGPYLGGRAFSFRDPSPAEQIDNGQHVYLGCCTDYIGFPAPPWAIFERTTLQRQTAGGHR